MAPVARANLHLQVTSEVSRASGQANAKEFRCVPLAAQRGWRVYRRCALGLKAQFLTVLSFLARLDSGELVQGGGRTVCDFVIVHCSVM